MAQVKSAALIALSAVLLSGCVVTPIERVPAPQPTYQQPQAGPLRIAGTWGLYDRGALVREVGVRRTRGGIVIDTPRNGPQFGERIARGAFRDGRGRVYQFTNDVEGVFDNPNNGRRLRMRRLR